MKTVDSERILTAQLRRITLNLTVFLLYFTCMALFGAYRAMYHGRGWAGCWIWVAGAAIMIIVILAARQSFLESLRSWSEKDEAAQFHWVSTVIELVFPIFLVLLQISIDWQQLLLSTHEPRIMQNSMRLAVALLLVVYGFSVIEIVREYVRCRR